MATLARCPSCGSNAVKLEEFRSLLVLSETRAIFTLRCSHCDHMVSVLETIPVTLQEEVQQAAREVNAGMGRSLT